ncbi:ABC transporter ATP-binding protein [bacterium]|nr:ABC transporter ATP-binding protein [bacterium]
MPIVEVNDLAKTYRVAQKKKVGVLGSLQQLFSPEYKTVSAVQGLSFQIDEGEMVAFLGPNGAGKTTTLKMLSGLIYPTAGTARVMTFVPWERRDDYRRQFSLVMGQKNQLWWDLPARESFRLHRDIYGLDPSFFTKTHDSLVELLRVSHLIDQPVRELSLGERMKMELVAALLHQPRVLFLDEPTIGLDVVAQTQIRDFLREHNRERGVTTLLTSHYMRDVESLCRRAIIINHGRLIYDGTLDGIVAKFTRFKTVKLQFAGEVPTDLAAYAPVHDSRGSTAYLRLERNQVASILAQILDRYAVDDVTVDEVPLEEVIADFFQSADQAASLLPRTAS